MAKLSGVNVSSIVSINTTNATSISYISGVATSTIPGWPGAAPGNGPTLIANPIIYDANVDDGANATSGSWTLSPGSTGSYIYEWFDTNDTLLSTAISPQYFEKDGGTWEYFNPGYSNISLLFQDVYLRVTAGDNTGTTVATSSIVRFEDTNLTTFLGNTGITGSTEIQALEYVQYQLRTNGFYYKIDYLPAIGNSVESHKWSMKGEYLDFSGSLSSTGSWQYTTAGMNNNGNGSADSHTDFGLGNNYNDVSIGFYSGTEVTENSVDVSLSELVYDNPSYYFNPIALGAKRNVSGSTYAYVEQGGTDTTSGSMSNFAVTSSVGMFIANTEDLFGIKRVKVYHNNTLLGYTTAVVAASNSKLYIGYRPGFVRTNSVSNKLYKFIFAGMSLTEGELMQLTNTVQEFQTMLGRQN